MPATLRSAVLLAFTVVAECWRTNVARLRARLHQGMLRTSSGSMRDVTTPSASSERTLVELEKLRPHSDAARQASAAFKEASQRQADALSLQMSFQEVPRFALSDPAGLQYLSEQGYVVLKGALSESEVSEAHDLLWEFLPGATGWRRGRMETWGQQGFASCGLPHWGIIKARGAGQSELVWYVRTRQAVREAFAKIWGTSRLISSFDGFNVFLPWHYGFDKTQFGWLHSDQGHAKRGLTTVQGFVALTDQDVTTGGLHVIPGTHHIHEHWVTQEHPGSPNDFCMIDPKPGGLGSVLLHLPQQMVSCKAGDLVLWDSRCVHCNMPAVAQPVTPEGELLRVVVYVCMLPKDMALEQELRLRRIAYNEGVSMNHWPLFNAQELQLHLGNGYGFKPRGLEDTSDGRRELIG